MLLDEITAYVEQKYAHISAIQHTFNVQKGKIIYQAHATHEEGGDPTLIVQKAILTVVNKVDVLDDELREEYRDHLVEHLSTRLPGTKETLLATLPLSLSAMTRQHIQAFLDTCMTLVHDQELMSIQDMQRIDTTVTHTENSIVEITEDTLAFLQEEGYLPE